MPVGSSYRYVAAATVACSGADCYWCRVDWLNSRTIQTIDASLSLSPSTQHYHLSDFTDYDDCDKGGTLEEIL